MPNKTCGFCTVPCNNAWCVTKRSKPLNSEEEKVKEYYESLGYIVHSVVQKGKVVDVQIELPKVQSAIMAENKSLDVTVKLNIIENK